MSFYYLGRGEKMMMTYHETFVKGESSWYMVFGLRSTTADGVSLEVEDIMSAWRKVE
tara:strand:- start:1156 stop:1326 length:171 start_codon:yes stop_codon:yes gene_type:complete